jgi:hypothetical protein
MLTPWPHQRKAIDRLKNGSVLVGDTGSGKSLVGLYYFYEKILPTNPKALYVITTATKRDQKDWHRDIAMFDFQVPIKIDSWNNVKKYTMVSGAFFIFDEQRAIGYGNWGRSFIKIAKRNRWIMLTATPADRWIDLMTVFIANGFYLHKTDFVHQHVIYNPFVTFPVIRNYINEEKLQRLKDKVFVEMPFRRDVKINLYDIAVEYDEEAVTKLVKSEWNPVLDRPVRSLGEHIHLIRQLVNSHPSRIEKVRKIQKVAKRLIVFYNFDFELDILKNGFPGITVAEHNGHKHEPVPEGEEWVYLVQYLSGNEAWECFETNHMCFFSLNYSYRIMKQAMGRINRLNSPFDELHYYRISSDYKLDKAVLNAIKNKKNFNIKKLNINM